MHSGRPLPLSAPSPPLLSTVGLTAEISPRAPLRPPLGLTIFFQGEETEFQGDAQALGMQRASEPSQSTRGRAPGEARPAACPPSPPPPHGAPAPTGLPCLRAAEPSEDGRQKKYCSHAPSGESGTREKLPAGFCAALPGRRGGCPRGKAASESCRLPRVSHPEQEGAPATSVTVWKPSRVFVLVGFGGWVVSGRLRPENDESKARDGNGEVQRAQAGPA